MSLETNIYRAIRYGMVPRMRSIIAKCSRLSCVWKSVMPRYSSNIMQLRKSKYIKIQSQQLRRNCVNIPDRPHVTWLCPAQFQDHFRCPIMSGRHDCTVMLVIKSSATKINQSNIGTLNLTHVPVLQNRKTKKKHL